uniref:Uncharacterized protein n=1 Tax=Anguilla anguilla TaxID=7936 RepID=A0A0E9TPK6_ANGAN
MKNEQKPRKPLTQITFRKEEIDMRESAVYV